MRTVMISPVCRALAWIRPRRAVAWGAVVALTLALFVARAEAQSLFFSEPFDGPGVEPNLEDPNNAYVVSGGVIRKDSSSGELDRHYVRTVRDDYRSNDWTYTISFDTRETGFEIVFIGVGAGEPNPPPFFNEPGNAAFFRIHSKSVSGASGRIDVAVMPTGQSWSLLDTIGFLPSDDVFTARIEKAGNQLAFSIDGVTAVHVISIPTFLDDTNTRLFFGNAGTVVEYDDMVVVELENQSPVCTGATASPSKIWPPNHQMVPIAITGVTDPDGDAVTITATSVSQDEAVRETGVGSGNTAPDATLSPLAVRAERNGNPKSPGNGRVYHINFTADDGNGGMCTGTVKVCVPHDQRPGATCMDGGPLYNSLAP